MLAICPVQQDELFCFVEIGDIALGVDAAGKVPCACAVARAARDDAKDEVAAVDAGGLDGADCEAKGEEDRYSSMFSTAQRPCLKYTRTHIRRERGR